jgi:hypothetical protein
MQVVYCRLKRGSDLCHFVGPRTICLSTHRLSLTIQSRHLSIVVILIVFTVTYLSGNHVVLGHGQSSRDALRQTSRSVTSRTPFEPSSDDRRPISRPISPSSFIHTDTRRPRPLSSRLLSPEGLQTLRGSHGSPNSNRRTKRHRPAPLSRLSANSDRKQAAKILPQRQRSYFYIWAT